MPVYYKPRTQTLREQYTETLARHGLEIDWEKGFMRYKGSEAKLLEPFNSRYPYKDAVLFTIGEFLERYETYGSFNQASSHERAYLAIFDCPASEAVFGRPQDCSLESYISSITDQEFARTVTTGVGRKILPEDFRKSVLQ